MDLIIFGGSRGEKVSEIFEIFGDGGPPTHKKKLEMIANVSAINSVQKSSKLELSSWDKRLFKVLLMHCRAALSPFKVLLMLFFAFVIILDTDLTAGLNTFMRKYFYGFTVFVDFFSFKKFFGRRGKAWGQGGARQGRARRGKAGQGGTGDSWGVLAP